MRITATEKAIGELNLRKYDLERVKALLEKHSSASDAMDEINGDLADIDRCVQLLRDVAPQPKPEKTTTGPKRGRKSRKSNGAAEPAEA